MFTMLQDYNHILVAVDGSESANNAFCKAVAVAKRDNAKLFIAHVIDTRAFQPYEAFDTTIKKSAIKEANQTLEACEQYANNHGLDHVTLLLENGSPKKIIGQDLPQKHNIDLIILGATGLNTVERFFIGSVSESVVRTALCDVLVIRTNIENKIDTIH